MLNWPSISKTFPWKGYSSIYRSNVPSDCNISFKSHESCDYKIEILHQMLGVQLPTSPLPINPDSIHIIIFQFCFLTIFIFNAKRKLMSNWSLISLRSTICRSSTAGCEITTVHQRRQCRSKFATVSQQLTRHIRLGPFEKMAVGRTEYRTNDVLEAGSRENVRNRINAQCVSRFERHENNCVGKDGFSNVLMCCKLVSATLIEGNRRLKRHSLWKISNELLLKWRNFECYYMLQAGSREQCAMLHHQISLTFSFVHIERFAMVCKSNLLL